MPEGDVHILGADTHIPRKYAPWALGGAAIVAFLALRSRASSQQQPTVDQSLAQAQASGNSYALEFYQAQAQARQEIAQLTASNAIEKQQLDQAYQLQAGLNPGLLAQTIPFNQWYSLGNDVRQSILNQVANGQLYETVGPNGYTFGPTQAGVSGHAPLVTARSSRGLFSASSTVTGPSGAVPITPPPTGDPGLIGIFDVILALLGDAGIVTPNAVPTRPNPPPTQSTIPQPWIYTPPFFPGYQ